MTTGRKLHVRRLRVAMLAAAALVSGCLSAHKEHDSPPARPETVVDLLKRTGGLSPSAAPEEIYIVRAQLGEGIPAEVLTVDLDAIVRKNDQRTNVRVQPLDEIYVGEQPRSRIERAVPTFLK